MSVNYNILNKIYEKINPKIYEVSIFNGAIEGTGKVDTLFSNKDSIKNYIHNNKIFHKWVYASRKYAAKYYILNYCKKDTFVDKNREKFLEIVDNEKEYGYLTTEYEPLLTNMYNYITEKFNNFIDKNLDKIIMGESISFSSGEFIGFFGPADVFQCINIHYKNIQ